MTGSWNYGFPFFARSLLYRSTHPRPLPVACHIPRENWGSVFPRPSDVWLSHVTRFGQRNVRGNNGAVALNVLVGFELDSWISARTMGRLCPRECQTQKEIKEGGPKRSHARLSPTKISWTSPPAHTSEQEEPMSVMQVTGIWEGGGGTCYRTFSRSCLILAWKTLGLGGGWYSLHNFI